MVRRISVRPRRCEHGIPSEIEAYLENQRARDWRDGLELVRNCGSCPKRRRCEAAMACLKRQLEVDPARFDGWMMLAQVKDYRGEVKEEVKAYRHAYEAAVEAGQWQIAEGVVERMKTVAPESVLTWVTQAEKWLVSGRCEEAREWLRSKTEQVISEGKSDDLLMLGESMLKIDGDCPEIRKAMGESLLEEARSFVVYGLVIPALEALCQAVIYQPEKTLALAREGASLLDGERSRVVDWLETRKQELEEAGEDEQWRRVRRFGDQLADLLDDSEQWARVPTKETESAPVVLAQCGKTQEANDGLELEAGDWVSNAFGLLGVIGRSEAPSWVSIWDDRRGECVGRAAVDRGRMAVGVHQAGGLFDGGERLSAGERERFREFWRSYERGAKGGTGPERSPELRDRLLVEAVNAAAVERWAKMATRRRLRVSIEEMGESRRRSGVANHPRRLALRLGRWAKESSGGAIVEVGEHLPVVVERLAWLARTEDGGWLAWKTEEPQSPGLEALMEWGELARRAEKIWKGGPEEGLDPWGYAMVSREGALGVYCQGQIMCIAQSPPSGMGALVRSLQQWEPVNVATQ